MKNWLRILSIPAIFATAALTVITLEIYLNFYLPDYSTFAGLVIGILLGASSAWHLVRRHMKNSFRAIKAMHEKEIEKLTKDRRLANVNAATYMTENYQLKCQIKELKLFRDEIAKAVKDLAKNMNKCLEEAPSAVINIDGNLELHSHSGIGMDNSMEKLAI
ncbi:MAG TPA: hypothetical protein VHO03_05745 [Ignavibacteriales bacterium]|nr:hypothetical protein [Ignavibacteriales bacterium]